MATQPAVELTWGRPACNVTVYQKQKARGIWTVTFSRSDRPPNDVVSNVTQNNSCTTPRKQRCSNTDLSKNIDTVEKEVAKAEKNNSIYPFARILYDGRTVHRGLVCFGFVLSQADFWHTNFCQYYVGSSTDCGHFIAYRRWSKVVNKDYISWRWKESTKQVRLPSSPIANREVANLEDMLPFSVRIGDLHVRAWSGIFEKHAVDLLFGTLFIDRIICRIFPTALRVLPGHWRSLVIV